VILIITQETEEMQLNTHLQVLARNYCSQYCCLLLWKSMKKMELLTPC